MELKSVEKRVGRGGNAGLEFAHGVPQFDTVEAADVPIPPGEVAFSRVGHGHVDGMGQKSQAAVFDHRIDEALRVTHGQRRQVAGKAQRQQMVLALKQRAVVDFFPHQKQDGAPRDPVVAFDALHQHVVVGDLDRVQTGSGRGVQHLGIRPVAVGEAGMHVGMVANFVEVHGKTKTAHMRRACTELLGGPGRVHANVPKLSRPGWMV